MISLIIPTYNEEENIAVIIQRSLRNLKKCKEDFEILVVDDNSKDNTGKIVRKIAKNQPVRLIVRTRDKGLSQSVRRGFKEAKGDIIGVIDADLSHPPELIPKLVKPLRDNRADITIGSRYTKGGGVVNWPMKRILISKFATILARPLTKVRDPMTGYFFLKKSVIKNKDKEMTSKGYKILLEILVKGNCKKPIEIPMIFKDRVKGTSKIGSKVIFNYLEQLMTLYHYKIFKK